MSFIGRLSASACDLPSGGPLGALPAGRARPLPNWLAHGHGENAEGDPRRRIAFTIAVIALGEVAWQFGFSAADYARIRALHAGPEGDGDGDPYAIPGISPGASAEAAREAYHRLVRERHPDLVIAQGLPPEYIALATARLARISTAYDQITKSGTPPE